MTDTETVKPADAALLREIADEQVGVYLIARLLETPEYRQERRQHVVARLRALADVLERVALELNGLEQILLIKPKPDVMDISIARTIVRSIRTELTETDAGA